MITSYKFSRAMSVIVKTRVNANERFSTLFSFQNSLWPLWRKALLFAIFIFILILNKALRSSHEREQAIFEMTLARGYECWALTFTMIDLEIEKRFNVCQLPLNWCYINIWHYDYIAAICWHVSLNIMFWCLFILYKSFNMF